VPAPAAAGGSGGALPDGPVRVDGVQAVPASAASGGSGGAPTVLSQAPGANSPSAQAPTTSTGSPSSGPDNSAPKVLAAGSNNSGSSNSGSSNSGSSNSGSSDGGSSNDTPAGPQVSPIDGLNANLKQIADNGAPDVKLSTETKNAYLKVINDYLEALKDQRKEMGSVQPLGQPVDPDLASFVPSATQTRNNLEMDVHGFGGITETMDKYIAYVQELHDTVNKAASRMIKAG